MGLWTILTVLALLAAAGSLRSRHAAQHTSDVHHSDDSELPHQRAEELIVHRHELDDDE